MSVFHHVIKSMGTRYDPLAGKVIAHVVGGGSVNNTTFRDLSPNNTPVVTVGSYKGATASGPFGTAVSLKPTPGVSTAGVVLNASDNRFQPDGGMTMGFTIDGWFRVPTLGAGTNYFRCFSLHTTGASTWGFGYNENHFCLSVTASDTSATVELVGKDGSTVLADYNVPVSSGQWLYIHIYVNKTTDIAKMRIHTRAEVSGTAQYVPAGDDRATPFSFTVGASAGGGTDGYLQPIEFYTFRVTKGLRPYNAALRTSPWPEAGGTQNWLGAPVGSSAPVGQKVLAHSEVWVVPPGITNFSAVAVGCKLSIGGTDVLAATWPVLGDGGGQGGAGGTGHSETVVTWSNGEPTTGFGGGGGTVRSEQTYTYYGGGGGAGGYTGNGGHGVNTQGSTASAGQGGGGGGGATQAWGGGVGLKGQGASGTGGSNPGQPGSANGTTYGGGKPGSGGTVNGSPGNNLAWRNNIPVTQGQVVLCTYIGQSGQTGAARLMWGDARSYPNNAGDVE